MEFKGQSACTRTARNVAHISCFTTILTVLSLAINCASQAASCCANEIVWTSDENSATTPLESFVWLSDEWADPVQFQQSLTPRIEAPTEVSSSTTSSAAAGQFWTTFGVTGPPSFASTDIVPVGARVVSGQESAIRATTDLGDLLGGSSETLDLGIQRRNPIVNDPHIRGSQIGSLAASGSYWVPARIDLDTMASKIDSRIVDYTTVIPGPYSALYGPGKQFMDLQLKRTPRNANGFQTNGSTSADYRTNGENWYGRQSVWGGDDVWGFRAGYGHRTGNDYESGNGLLIPGSHKSRDIDLALGAQITPDSAIEAQALRLDQTDLELAGQAFDIDWLVTDGYEVEYTVENPGCADWLTIEGWYNRTVFAGDAQRSGKRKQFPYYDFINFTGFTDVDSLSTGYRLIAHWELDSGGSIDAGSDLRYLKQDLNEISSGRLGFAAWTDANSPIPKSDYVNPGLFLEASLPATEQITLVAGGRIDYVGTRVLAAPSQLEALGIQSQLGPPLSAYDIWGSDATHQNDLLGLGYVGLEGQAENGWGLGAKVGYSERPPNLTERYVAESFMALIQNGLNSVTGDPDLKKERLIQTDVKIFNESDRSRFEVGAFYGWVDNWVTYEAMSAVVGPPNGQIEQVNLKYVNTDLATLWGWQARYEYKWNDLLTPFATLQYIQGDDRRRDGDFATRQASAGTPSTQVYGMPRGSFSGIPGNSKEPLPGIIPLESRVGLRWEENQGRYPWGAEIGARIVDNQSRVATSLLETPTPGFTVWDLRTFVRPCDKWLLVGGIENFTDKQYREHLDYRSRNPLALDTFRAGVNFYFGMEANY